MATIEELLGTPMDQMSDEELLGFVRSSRAKRTSLIEDASMSNRPASTTRKPKKVVPIPDDLLDLMEDL